MYTRCNVERQLQGPSGCQLMKNYGSQTSVSTPSPFTIQPTNDLLRCSRQPPGQHSSPAAGPLAPGPPAPGQLRRPPVRCARSRGDGSRRRWRQRSRSSWSAATIDARGACSRGSCSAAPPGHYQFTAPAPARAAPSAPPRPPAHGKPPVGPLGLGSPARLQPALLPLSCAS
jgi:hypothetical protein